MITYYRQIRTLPFPPPHLIKNFIIYFFFFKHHSNYIISLSRRDTRSLKIDPELCNPTSSFLDPRFLSPMPFFLPASMYSIPLVCGFALSPQVKSQPPPGFGIRESVVRYDMDYTGVCAFLILVLDVGAFVPQCARSSFCDWVFLRELLSAILNPISGGSCSSCASPGGGRRLLRGELNTFFCPFPYPPPPHRGL